MTWLRYLLDRWRAGRARPLPSTVVPGRASALARRSMLRLPDPAGRTLCCLSGALWITVDGHPEDLTLGPGERHLFLRRARAIVSALEPATLLLLDREGRCLRAATTGSAQLVEP
jgi:hypothetical protein